VTTAAPVVIVAALGVVVHRPLTRVPVDHDEIQGWPDAVRVWNVLGNKRSRRTLARRGRGDRRTSRLLRRGGQRSGRVVVATPLPRVPAMEQRT
jgi:hypothetical protein